ncbi:hypothetical protein FE257_009814 [Aspergillus nanangensis]|uniref:Uncharacterized protein n=1 Tax=Aspergillus nanangensis TaxID=2582783 RepID=A0AAD4CJB4_ASPNN|nr:hypothetical protein FE257_009814 [Aspergillus nanangensis]
MSPADHAFQQLAHIFSTRANRVLEIEILPPTLGGPLLQDGCSIGITKKFLAQAFVTARQVFFEGSKDLEKSEASLTNSSSEDGNTCRLKSVEDISVASEIILLFDCEHLTACNWRKRSLMVLTQNHSPKTPIDHETLIHALSSEVTLMSTFMCSPLRRHTKSPTLWEHRLWVLKHLLRAQASTLAQPQTEPQSSAMENMLELWKEEVSVVFRAGELHPRNYYAFSYLRELHHVLSSGMEDSVGCATVLAQSANGSTLEWCLAHTTDISGWMFLLYLLHAIPNVAIRTNTITKAVCFARDIGWEGESLWTFVDLAASAFLLDGPVTDTLSIAHNPVAEARARPNDKTRKDGARWEPRWKGWMAMARAYRANSQ